MTTPILTVTSSALQQIKALLKGRAKPAYGIRIGLKTKGCNGLSYSLEYADEKGPYDEEILMEELRILIDPKAIMYLLGTEMDFRQSELESGFVFRNPNEKGRCGCGESFHV